MYRLILASESPRRRDLLTKAGFAFDTFPVKVSEIPEKSLMVDEKILSIAKQKLDAAWTLLQSRKNPPFVLLAADTEVVLDDQLLGKPSSDLDAQNMLRRLSGRTHEVKTAIYLAESLGHKIIFHIETTQIHFRKLSTEEILEYVASGEGRDKAGGYGIQGQARKFVAKIEGSFDNVVGLPVDRLTNLLKKENWVINNDESAAQRN